MQQPFTKKILLCSLALSFSCFSIAQPTNLTGQQNGTDGVSSENLSKTISGKSTVYKWKDASGKIYYTDTSPPILPNKTESKQFSTGTSPTLTVASTSQSKLDLTQAPKTNQTTADLTTADDFEKERQKQCQRAKLNLTTLSAGGRIQLVDEQGQKISLDESGVKKEKGFAEQAVSSWCQSK